MMGTIRWGRLVGVLSLLLVLICSPAARAETDQLCVAQAVGVPGPQPKTPEWWNPALTAIERETRWTGATRIYDNGSVSPELASGRVIWDGPSAQLFFEFQVDGDPTIDPDKDIVAFATSDPTGTFPDLYIHFVPMNDCTVPANCAGLGIPMSGTSVFYSQASPPGLTWSTLSNTNPSTAWAVQHPWVEMRQTGSSYRWILRFALSVPTDPVTGEALANQRFYSNTLMYMQGPTSGTVVEFPLLCKPSSLITNDCQIASTGLPTLPDAIPVTNMGTIWSHVTTGSVASCDGVDIQTMLVGANYRMRWGYIPGTTVLYKFPSQRIPYYSGAKLRAGFHNDTASPLSAGDITADVRISNWGLRWGSSSMPSWSWIASADLDATVTAGGYGGAPSQGKIQTTLWVPQTSGLTFTSPYQAMHVQLTANVGGINFKRDSVYRKMVLVNASVFRRPGDLDLSGRPLPAGHTEHEVYLLTRRYHMPSEAECADAGQTLVGCVDGGPLYLDDGGQGTARPVKGSQVLEQGVAMGLDAEPLPVESQGLPLEELPRYSVHAFADTGATLDLPGAPGTAVLEQFSAYGYYIEHEGEPSQGFEHYVHVMGSEPVEGIPDLYHVSVPEGQILAVANTVRVVDGIQTTCLDPPESDAFMPPDDALALAEALMVFALDGSLATMKVTDDDFGCAPPPLRAACAAGDCLPHNPVSYIEGSAYVGEWTEPEVEGMYAQAEAMVAMGMAAAELGPLGLVAPGSADDEGEEVLEEDFVDLPHGMQDACCAQASIDPQAGRRGAAKTTALLMVLLLLRRRRRRREDSCAGPSARGVARP